MRRRALKQEQDKCLTAWVKRYSEEQKQAELDAVTEQIMELKPDWTEEQARIAARMSLDQKQSRSAQPGPPLPWLRHGFLSPCRSAAAHGTGTLILGAFGCGAVPQSPADGIFYDGQ